MFIFVKKLPLLSLSSNCVKVVQCIPECPVIFLKRHKKQWYFSETVVILQNGSKMVHVCIFFSPKCHNSFPVSCFPVSLSDHCSWRDFRMVPYQVFINAIANLDGNLWNTLPEQPPLKPNKQGASKPSPAKCQSSK